MLDWVVQRTSAKGVAIALCALVVILIVVRQLRREVLMIAPFDVPKTLADGGLTGAVLAERVGAEIEGVFCRRD
jgi:hypothetical protein